MASLEPGTAVKLTSAARAGLNYLPLEDAELFIAVHKAALRAKNDRATAVFGFRDDQIVWVAGFDERLLDVRHTISFNRPRSAIQQHMLKGRYCWSLIRPMALIKPGHHNMGAVYQGTRPWLVLGELPHAVLAAPLNDASTNPKWYSPFIAQRHVRFPGSSKNSQVELPHLWSLPMEFEVLGDVADAVRPGLSKEVLGYFE